MSFNEFTQEDYDLIERTYSSFADLARERCPKPEEFAVVQKAFDFANQAHRNVRRRSGEPYILHPIEVARIVVSEIGLGYKSLSAALLHDVVEDTEYTVEDIRNLFGDKIAQLVDGLTKIKTVLDNEDRLKGASIQTESMQAENFKRILLTLGDDARVVLIKLADRLHNCRTIEFMPEHKRDKILSETMFIFIPLAHRLGLYSIKSEMENIWLRYKEPDDYLEISSRVSRRVQLRDKDIEDFIAPIVEALTEKGIRFTIKKRIKTPYSIWYKMRTKQVPFDQIYDLYAVRIIYENDGMTIDEERDTAFVIFRIISGLYSSQPARMRNWIQSPKSNGYEALHCTLMSHSGVWVEAQIRSRRMDDIAEKGIAAHWAYKNNGYASENDTEMDRWLVSVQEVLQSKDINTLELLDIIHSDLVSNSIVVFTPKGQQKSIPAGSTALDFAYAIHSHIGNKAIAAKVNMKLVTLSQQLKSGDQVEIITAGSAHPKMEWLKFLQTRYAKNSVIEYFRDKRSEIAAEGEKLYEERLRMAGQKNSNVNLRKFLDYTQLKDVNEFYFRVGLGLIGPDDFHRALNEDAVQLHHNAGKYLISAGDTGQRKYVMAECCQPIPGDPVIGFLSGDGTVILHKKTCVIAEGLASKYGNLVVVPQWILQEKEYPIRVSIKGVDRLGLLSDLTKCISLNLGINMRKLQLGAEDGVFEGYIELLVRDRKVLDNLISSLEKIQGIQSVVRTDI